MEDRWNVALDICSVKALKGAFEACLEDDGYDMGELSPSRFCDRLFITSKTLSGISLHY